MPMKPAKLDLSKFTQSPDVCVTADDDRTAAIIAVLQRAIQTVKEGSTVGYALVLMQRSGGVIAETGCGGEDTDTLTTALNDLSDDIEMYPDGSG